MEYQIKPLGSCLLIVLSKNITLYEVGRFKEALEEAKKSGNNRIVIDLEKVGFIDALALSALTSFANGIRDAGGDVKLARLNEDVKAVFDLTHLSKIYEIFDDVNKAAGSFS